MFIRSRRCLSQRVSRATWSLLHTAAGLVSGCAKSLDMPDKDGDTPLLMAAQEGRVESVKLILGNSKPGMVDIPNKHKETPLLLAAQEGNADVVEALLKEGRSKAINTPASDGRTPLLVAARVGATKVLQILLDHGADRTATVKGSDWIGSDGTAEDIARDNGHTHVLTLLTWQS